MNWRLIFLLSLFGLVMGIATVYWIPSKIEPAFWLVVFLLSAYFVAKNAGGKYFLTGFCVSLVNCIWITAAHILLYQTYMPNHPDEVNMMNKMGMGDHPRRAMLMTGPVVGIISGIVLGLFSWIASMIFKKTPATAS